MCDEQEQQGRPNQLFFRGNHLDWPSQPNRRPPGTPIWPNLARVIDLQEFMGRRRSHPPSAPLRAPAGANCSSEALEAEIIMAMPRNLQRPPAKPAFGNGRIQWQEILSSVT